MTLQASMFKASNKRVLHGRWMHQGIGPANTPKQLINYSYFVLRMRRHTPEHMTINQQRQENINNHLRKIRQQYSTHAQHLVPSRTACMLRVREQDAALSLHYRDCLLEIHNLGLNIGPAAAVPVPVPVFCAGQETNTWCWRRTHFTLETNTLKTRVRTTAINTQLATSDFQTKLMSKWSLFTTTHLQELELSSCGDPKGIQMHIGVSRGIKLVFKRQ